MTCGSVISCACVSFLKERSTHFDRRGWSWSWAGGIQGGYEWNDEIRMTNDEIEGKKMEGKNMNAFIFLPFIFLPIHMPTKSRKNRCKACGDTWYPKDGKLSRKC